MNENSFIAQLKKSNRYIGDDAAVVNSLAYSADMFVENVHFKQAWMSIEQAITKAFIVNLSDAVAMNATAKYVLCMLQLPRHFSSHEKERVSRSILLNCTRFNVELIGGDTVVADEFSISLSVISHPNRKKLLTRKGVKPKALLAFTGTLGGSYKGLRSLQNGAKLNAKSRFIEPVLKQAFIYASARYLQAGMDISDGLSTDLNRLGTINNLGFSLKYAFKKQLICSGEEYEMLVAFSARARKAVIRRAQATRTRLTIFATSVRGRFHDRCKEHHF